MAVVRPRDLLSQALRLTELSERRPRQADLRRSVATSYYAIFHGLTEASAKLLISGAARAEMRVYVRRGYGHSQMRDVCYSFYKGSLPRRLPIAAHEVSPELRKICAAFVELQKERHLADYDHTRTYSKQEAKDFHQLATRTLDLLDALDSRAPGNFAFLVALFANPLIH